MANLLEAVILWNPRRTMGNESVVPESVIGAHLTMGATPAATTGDEDRIGADERGVGMARGQRLGMMRNREMSARPSDS